MAIRQQQLLGQNHGEQGAHQHQLHVLTHEEDAPAHARVLQVEADDLRLAGVHKAERGLIRGENVTIRIEQTGQLDNTAEIGKVRKQIARINTLIRQREIAAAEVGQ